MDHVGDCGIREDAFFEDIEHHVADHAQLAAQRAKAKLGGSVNRNTLDRFLRDPDCMRYPVEIVFDASPLEDHQFAEPAIVVEEGKPFCRLHVHPRFAGRNDALPHFVSYMAAVINYGAVATPELCESYGAALVGEDRETFYQKVCAFAVEASD